MPRKRANFGESEAFVEAGILKPRLMELITNAKIAWKPHKPITTAGLLVM
jgi:hypothetical protein